MESGWKEKRYGSESEEHCGIIDPVIFTVLAAGIKKAPDFSGSLKFP